MKKAEIYSEIQDAYDIFNQFLFDNTLPSCIITLNRRGKFFGYFIPDCFVSAKDNKLYTSEIALNPFFFSERTLENTLSTLVHEMCHYRTYLDGKQNKAGYHGKYWSNMMEEKGLIPSDTGLPGGKKIGYKVSHYIDEKGSFIKIFQKIKDNDIIIPWYDRIALLQNEEEEKKDKKEKLAGKKYKYSCGCSQVWGKKGLSLYCGKCKNPIVLVV